MLLTPHASWRTQPAPRAALLIDMAAYFDAAMKAMGRAKHCVHLLNWAFKASRPVLEVGDAGRGDAKFLPGRGPKDVCRDQGEIRCLAPSGLIPMLKLKLKDKDPDGGGRG